MYYISYSFTNLPADVIAEGNVQVLVVEATNASSCSCGHILDEARPNIMRSMCKTYKKTVSVEEQLGNDDHDRMHVLPALHR